MKKIISLILTVFLSLTSLNITVVTATTTKDAPLRGRDFDNCAITQLRSGGEEITYYADVVKENQTVVGFQFSIIQNSININDSLDVTYYYNGTNSSDTVTVTRNLSNNKNVGGYELYFVLTTELEYNKPFNISSQNGNFQLTSIDTDNNANPITYTFNYSVDYSALSFEKTSYSIDAWNEYTSTSTLKDIELGKTEVNYSLTKDGSPTYNIKIVPDVVVKDDDVMRISIIKLQNIDNINLVLFEKNSIGDEDQPYNIDRNCFDIKNDDTNTNIHFDLNGLSKSGIPEGDYYLFSAIYDGGPTKYYLLSTNPFRFNTTGKGNPNKVVSVNYDANNNKIVITCDDGDWISAITNINISNKSFSESDISKDTNTATINVSNLNDDEKYYDSISITADYYLQQNIQNEKAGASLQLMTDGFEKWGNNCDFGLATIANDEFTNVFGEGVEGNEPYTISCVGDSIEAIGNNKFAATGKPGFSLLVAKNGEDVVDTAFVYAGAEEDKNYDIFIKNNKENLINTITANNKSVQVQIETTVYDSNDDEYKNLAKFASDMSAVNKVLSVYYFEPKVLYSDGSKIDGVVFDTSSLSGSWFVPVKIDSYVAGREYFMMHINIGQQAGNDGIGGEGNLKVYREGEEYYASFWIDENKIFGLCYADKKDVSDRIAFDASNGFKVTIDIDDDFTQKDAESLMAEVLSNCVQINLYVEDNPHTQEIEQGPDNIFISQKQSYYFSEDKYDKYNKNPYKIEDDQLIATVSTETMKEMGIVNGTYWLYFDSTSFETINDYNFVIDNCFKESERPTITYEFVDGEGLYITETDNMGWISNFKVNQTDFLVNNFVFIGGVEMISDPESHVLMNITYHGKAGCYANLDDEFYHMIEVDETNKKLFISEDVIQRFGLSEIEASANCDAAYYIRVYVEGRPCSLENEYISLPENLLAKEINSTNITTDYVLTEDDKYITITYNGTVIPDWMKLIKDGTTEREEQFADIVDYAFYENSKAAICVVNSKNSNETTHYLTYANKDTDKANELTFAINQNEEPWCDMYNDNYYDIAIVAPGYNPKVVGDFQYKTDITWYPVNELQGYGFQYDYNNTGNITLTCVDSDSDACALWTDKIVEDGTIIFNPASYGEGHTLKANKLSVTHDGDTHVITITPEVAKANKITLGSYYLTAIANGYNKYNATNVIKYFDGYIGLELEGSVASSDDAQIIKDSVELGIKNALKEKASNEVKIESNGGYDVNDALNEAIESNKSNYEIEITEKDGDEEIFETVDNYAIKDCKEINIEFGLAGEEEKFGKITELNDYIEIEFDLPDDYQEGNEYFVYYEHEGYLKKITEYEVRNNKLVFKTREFSTYSFGEAMIFTSKDAYALSIGDVVNLNAKSKENKAITYSSLDDEVVSVDANGNITALENGATAVVVSCGNYNKIIHVMVLDKESVEFTVQEDASSSKSELKVSNDVKQVLLESIAQSLGDESSPLLEVLSSGDFDINIIQNNNGIDENDYEKIVKDIGSNGGVLQCSNISIIVSNKEDPNNCAYLTKLTEKIVLGFTLPSAYKNVPSGYERTYYVYINHNRLVKKLNSWINNNGELCTESDEYSPYYIAYKDRRVDDSDDYVVVNTGVR